MGEEVNKQTSTGNLQNSRLVQPGAHTTNKGLRRHPGSNGKLAELIWVDQFIKFAHPGA